MTTVHRVFNFAAGPAVMPVSVLEQIQRDMLALPGVGMSIFEISHRSKEFEEILARTEDDIRTLASIPPSHAVLFLQGGASLQFSMVPAGLTIVIVRNDLLERSKARAATLPTMLNYALHAENNSLYNTPPVVAVYATGLVMKWLRKQGGLPAIAEINERKAAKLYAE